MKAKQDDSKPSAAGQYYDYVVVGAGTGAMGFLHGLLVHTRNAMKERATPIRVAVLERGPRDMNSLSNPLRQWYQDASSESSRNSHSYGARFYDNQQGHFAIPTGMGRGGTTNINAGLCLQPPYSDFDPTKGWPKGFVASMQVVERHLQEWIRASRQQDYQKEALDTAVKFKLQHMRTVPCLANQNGLRVNYYEALVEPFLCSDAAQSDSSTRDSVSIDWIDNATVERILLNTNKTTATGVTYTVSDECSSNEFDALYGRNIILACGVLESPALLVASGLLPTSTEFPLQDHVMLPSASIHFPWSSIAKARRKNCGVEMSCNGVAELFNWEAQSQDGREDFSFQVGRMDSAVFPYILPSLAADFLVRRFWSKSGVQDRLAELIQTILGLLLRYLVPAIVLEQCLTVLCLFLLAPARRVGHFRVVAVKEAADRDGCLMESCRSRLELDIRLHYLKNGKDVEAYAKYWNILCTLVMRGSVEPSSPLSSYGTTTSLEVFPSKIIRRNPAWFATWSHTFCLPYFHWCSSLAGLVKKAKGPDDDSGVDIFSVLSVKNLSVCDASILPQIPRAPTALTCATVGYHCAVQTLRGSGS